MSQEAHTPPTLFVREWLNTPTPITLESLKGKVVLIEAFQMLCPGCVSHGLPQAVRVQETFRKEDVAVLGLHTVFEHHDAQQSATALRAFLHEYRIPFPVGIDMPEDGPLPRTMTAFAMQGTPTLLLFDRAGNLRAQHFGSVPDLRLGAEIMSLVGEREGLSDVAEEPDPSSLSSNCDEEGCVVAAR